MFAWTMVDYLVHMVRLKIRWPHGQRGGVALIMLVGFVGLAVPVTVASLETSATLSLASRVYDDRLQGAYSAEAGVEFAIHNILNDPTFDDDLTAASPTKGLTANINGESVAVSVTKIFGSGPLQGQGLILSKAVTPTTAPVRATTTYSYTLTIKNEGTDTADIEEVYDYLPPGFNYDAGSTTGITTDDPVVNTTATATCGSAPEKLFWNIPTAVEIDPGQELTLTFQATANLPDGTYLNQASLRYDPWWTSPRVDVFTPYTAEVTVGSGGPKCGYDLHLLLTQDVVPKSPTPGVPTEFTYTITAENVMSSDTAYVCKMEDLLPPAFTYVTNSTGDYPSNIWTLEPEEKWQSASERWKLRWADGPDAALQPLQSIPAGQSKTQVFRALATPESGVNYFNEVEVVWSKSIVGPNCNLAPGSGGTSYNGPGDATFVDAPTNFDVQAAAADATVQARLVHYKSNGEIEVVSWQKR